jgi:zinc transporter, ZIP family
MKRLVLLALVVGAVGGAGLVFGFARGDTVRTAGPDGEPGLTVQRSTLQPGLILLFARNEGADPVRVAQVLVNDAFVDFHAVRLAVPPGGRTQLAVHYAWIAGESYEIGLLTATGAIVEYELEDAGEV